MTNPKHLPPQALDEWLAAASEELQLDPAQTDIATVLDIARDVAHQVARPAAPLSTFLVGVAVGRSGDPAALGRAAAQITQLAERWELERER